MGIADVWALIAVLVFIMIVVYSALAVASREDDYYDH